MDANSRLTSVASLAVLLAASPAYCADNSPFSIEASELVPYAFSVFDARFADVSPGALEPTSTIFFNCHTRTKMAGPSALRAAQFYCTATVNFDVSNTGPESVRVDSNDNCLVFKPASVAMVRMHDDDRARVRLLHDSETEGLVVDCDDQVIAVIAAENEDIRGQEERFSVDARRILEMAFEAAIENYPDIPPQQIVYGDGGPNMSVTCESAPGMGGRNPLVREVGPCSASVMLADDSVSVEYRYVEGSSCMIGKSTDWISVRIDETGDAQVDYHENSGGGHAWGVECDEAFYNSPLPLIESPREGKQDL